jgi:RNA polymerase sigma-70 factor, ECF subfamily
MADYQAGSAEAFDRLHDALVPELRAYLTALTRDPTRADDLLQETFLQMHRSRAAHIPGEAVKPWVYAIAKRVFLMHRRSTARRERREFYVASGRVDEAKLSTEAERLHARQQVDVALRQVPSDGRRAFLLHHWFGFSFKEVAARLGITTGTAKIRSSRAASVMRAFLRENRDE